MWVHVIVIYYVVIPSLRTCLEFFEHLLIFTSEMTNQQLVGPLTERTERTSRDDRLLVVGQSTMDTVCVNCTEQSSIYKAYNWSTHICRTHFTKIVQVMAGLCRFWFLLENRHFDFDLCWNGLVSWSHLCYIIERGIPFNTQQQCGVFYCLYGGLPTYCILVSHWAISLAIVISW